jgi:hypothetical protein
MKRTALKSSFLLVLLFLFSCDEPETVVTNIIHPDGSVTRKIEMRNKKNEFKPSSLQVPFDSTWTIKDTITIGEKKDTTWIKTAEKLFKNADEINQSYLADKGVNKGFSRKTLFVKKFKWFNTEYKFSELIDRKMSEGYPVSDFLNQDELNWFYSPDGIRTEKKDGVDSLKFRAFEDTINRKVDRWFTKCIVSEWIYKFSRLTEGKTGNDLNKESLKAHEDDFALLISKYDNKFDSLWAKGIILKEMIGEKYALMYKTEADSALSMMEKIILLDFKDYSVRIIMPGKVIGTNGFIDKTDVLLWPVKSDYFMTEPYEMWAESKVVNTWAWAITGAFILFVIIGLLIRVFRK